MLARADRYAMTASNDDQALVRVHQMQPSWTVWLSLTVASAVVVSLIGGVFLATSEALSQPDALALARERPFVTLQIATGIALLAMLVLVPVRRLVRSIGRAGLVEIDSGLVRVREQGLLSARSFNEPLAAYLGIAHRMRTTLSGVEHELVLVHPDRRRDVVVAVEGPQPALAARRMMDRLALPEIAAGDIIRVRAGAALAPSAFDGALGVGT